MKIIVYIAIALLTFFIQAQLFPIFFHGTWIPNLILTWVVVLTLIKGRKTGIMVALIGGLLHDILISNFFGLHFFPYLILAYLFSMPKHRVYEEQWYISFIAVAIASLINGFITMIMLYFAKEQVLPFLYIWHHSWPELWANGIVAILLHELIWRMEEKEEYIW